MFEVGSNLSVEQFSPRNISSGVIVRATLLHLFLVPLAALCIFWTAALDPVIGMGLLLIAAAPIGAMSNYYVNVARGDLALSVLLTGVTSLLAFVSAPLICLLIARLLDLEAIGSMPFGQILRQTIPNVLVPVVAGMAARYWMRDWIVRHQRARELLGFALVAVLIGVVLGAQAGLLTWSLVLSAASTAMVFTVLLLCIGWCAGWLLMPDSLQTRRTGLMFGFPARNIGLSALMAANVFGKIELAAFGAIFFVTQLLMLVPIALWVRRSHPHSAC